MRFNIAWTIVVSHEYKDGLTLAAISVAACEIEVALLTLRAGERPDVRLAAALPLAVTHTHLIRYPSWVAFTCCNRRKVNRLYH